MGVESLFTNAEKKKFTPYFPIEEEVSQESKKLKTEIKCKNKSKSNCNVIASEGSPIDNASLDATDLIAYFPLEAKISTDECLAQNNIECSFKPEITNEMEDDEIDQLIYQFFAYGTNNNDDSASKWDALSNQNEFNTFCMHVDEVSVDHNASSLVDDKCQNQSVATMQKILGYQNYYHAIQQHSQNRTMNRKRKWHGNCVA